MASAPSGVPAGRLRERGRPFPFFEGMSVNTLLNTISRDFKGFGMAHLFYGRIAAARNRTHSMIPVIFSSVCHLKSRLFMAFEAATS